MYTQGFGVLFVLFLCAIAFALSTLLISWVVSPKAPTALKSTPYESGMAPFGEAHIRFDVKFYLYSLLFILFDIEAIFLFPWAVSFTSLGLLGLLEMVVFVGILFLGLVYAWRRNALEWQ
jgi:NADH:ubiquinone oxidoreductase subunit 3 (subunit A)